MVTVSSLAFTEFLTFSKLSPRSGGFSKVSLEEVGAVLQFLKDRKVGVSLGDFQVGLYQSEEGSQLKAGNDPWWSLKSPSPSKDGVGVVDVELSTRVPSNSSDVVVSGEA